MTIMMLQDFSAEKNTSKRGKLFKEHRVLSHPEKELLIVMAVSSVFLYSAKFSTGPKLSWITLQYLGTST
jgi:hypothetical protein